MKAFLSSTVLSLALLASACHHFPRVPMSRSLSTGQKLALSHNRVCAGESDPIQVTFTPDSALTWVLNAESGQQLKTGTIGAGMALETNDLIEGRYELLVKVDDENSLTANFEVFHCNP